MYARSARSFAVGRSFARRWHKGFRLPWLRDRDQADPPFAGEGGAEGPRGREALSTDGPF